MSLLSEMVENIHTIRQKEKNGKVKKCRPEKIRTAEIDDCLLLPVKQQELLEILVCIEAWLLVSVHIDQTECIMRIEKSLFVFHAV